MKWSLEQLRALHTEWLRTLDDSQDSGPFSEQSNGNFYVGAFLDWLARRPQDQPGEQHAD